MAKPFAYVNLDLLDANSRAIAMAAGDKKIRVASKSIRSLEVLRRIMHSDDVFQGVMCYTVREASFLLKQGFDDLLIGYPAWDKSDITALLQEADTAGHVVVFMIDSIQHAQHMEQLAAEIGIPALVCLDIDMSADYPGLHFGIWRSPINSWVQAKPVVERITQSKWLRLDGVMGYEAQIAGVTDQISGKWLKNRMIRQLKQRSIREVAKRREEVLQGIQALGIELRFVNAGGTGSMDSSKRELGVTEITVGSGFYSPALFDHYAGFQYLPAAGYAVEIVRQPRADIVTCLGGGYSASGAAGVDKLPQPYLPEGMKLLPLEGAGEVQTPLLCPSGLELELGDPIFFRHAKAGELCERFSKLYAISGDSIVGEYFTYRGDGECFL